MNSVFSHIWIILVGYKIVKETNVNWYHQDKKNNFIGLEHREKSRTFQATSVKQPLGKKEKKKRKSKKKKSVETFTKYAHCKYWKCLYQAVRNSWQFMPYGNWNFTFIHNMEKNQRTGWISSCNVLLIKQQRLHCLLLLRNYGMDAETALKNVTGNPSWLLSVTILTALRAPRSRVPALLVSRKKTQNPPNPLLETAYFY